MLRVDTETSFGKVVCIRNKDIAVQLHAHLVSIEAFKKCRIPL